jgi:hypothetical protein
MADNTPINPWCPACSQPLMAPEKVENPETKESFTMYPCVNTDGAHYSSLNSFQVLDYDHDYTEAKRQERADAAKAEEAAKAAAPEQPAKKKPAAAPSEA